MEKELEENEFEKDLDNPGLLKSCRPIPPGPVLNCCCCCCGEVCCWLSLLEGICPMVGKLDMLKLGMSENCEEVSLKCEKLDMSVKPDLPDSVEAIESVDI